MSLRNIVYGLTLTTSLYAPSFLDAVDIGKNIGVDLDIANEGFDEDPCFIWGRGLCVGLDNEDNGLLKEVPFVRAYSEGFKEGRNFGSRERYIEGLISGIGVAFSCFSLYRLMKKRKAEKIKVS